MCQVPSPSRSSSSSQEICLLLHLYTLQLCQVPSPSRSSSSSQVTGLLIVGINFGPFITALYCRGLFLGTIYSVPPFRMKRFPVVAFLIIATLRGFLLNFGVYYATRAALGLTFEWSLPVAFITTFVTLFALVIAITKDLPDVEGDRKFQISTLATKLGVRNIAFLGSGLLLLNYIGAILAAAFILRHGCWKKQIIQSGPPRFEGDRPRFGDRDGYRGGPRGGPPGEFGGEKGGAPADFQPTFRVSLKRFLAWRPTIFQCNGRTGDDS